MKLTKSPFVHARFLDELFVQLVRTADSLPPPLAKQVAVDGSKREDDLAGGRPQPRGLANDNVHTVGKRREYSDVPDG